MHNYDFTTILDRHNRDSLAADCMPNGFADFQVENGFSKIPMWVADMSFPVFPGIVNAIKARLEMPNFGYFNLSEQYYSAIKYWHSKYKNLNPDISWIGYENGVLGGVASAFLALTDIGESILVHSPVYVGFTEVFKGTGRKAVHSPLYLDQNNIWRMDYNDMEKKIKDNNIRLAIFCSPHNPTGRVWERWEIEKAMEVYEKYNCYVISDEIWSDIVMPGYEHTPTLNITGASERTISLYAPSKTFSIAGIEGSYHFIPNKDLRKRLEKQGMTSRYNNSNVLSMHALIGAYTDDGREWRNNMISVISKNIDYAYSWFTEHVPGTEVMKSQGTYMIYPNFSKYCSEKHISIREIQEKAIKCGVIWQNGEDFFVPNTVRMNLASPFSLIEEAFDRLGKYVFTCKKP